MAKKIVKAVKKVAKKAAAKVVKKKVVKKVEEVVLTECVACNGRGLESSVSLCRYCHGSGRV